MTEPSTRGVSTRVSRIIKAPRKAVYQAFLDRDAVVSWLPPETMKGHVHTFDPREGGKFPISLTYQDPKHSPGGKTSEDTDTCQGRFVELVPCEKIVWVIEFESQDPAFVGEMSSAWQTPAEEPKSSCSAKTFQKVCGPEDNELGCRSSLQNLAALLE